MKMIEIIKNQKVHFMHYRDGEMWYTTDNGFIFPVPIHDKREIGNATFQRDDKAIYFMRYIRKYKEELDVDKDSGK